MKIEQLATEPDVAVELDKVLQEIDRQGAKLADTAAEEDLKAYRGLLKEFVITLVSHLYALNTKGGGNKLGRQKVYSTVRKVDRELEAMAEKIHLGQTEGLNIGASHEAIRGMLVGLYM